MQDSEINRVCEELYRKHTKAIDTLLNNIPSAQNKLKQATKDAVKRFIAKNKTGLKLASSSNTINRFSTPTLNKEPFLSGTGWSNTNNLILWEVVTTDQSAINLDLVLGKGPEELRKRIYSSVTAAKNREKNTFIPHKQKMNFWARLWRCELISYDDATVMQKTPEELEKEILDRLEQHKANIEFMDGLLEEFRKKQ